MNKFVLSVVLTVAASCSLASAQTLFEGCDKLYQYFETSKEVVLAGMPDCYKDMINEVHPDGLGNTPVDIGKNLFEVHLRTPPMQQVKCAAENIENIHMLVMSMAQMASAIPQEIDSKCTESFQLFVEQVRAGIGGNSILDI